MSRATADALRAQLDVQEAQMWFSVEPTVDRIERLHAAMTVARAAVRAVEMEDGSR